MCSWVDSQQRWCPLCNLLNLDSFIYDNTNVSKIFVSSCVPGNEFYLPGGGGWKWGGKKYQCPFVRLSFCLFLSIHKAETPDFVSYFLLPLLLIFLLLALFAALTRTLTNRSGQLASIISGATVYIWLRFHKTFKIMLQTKLKARSSCIFVKLNTAFKVQITYILRQRNVFISLFSQLNFQGF